MINKSFLGSLISHWRVFVCVVPGFILLALTLNHTIMPKYLIEVVLSPIDEAGDKASQLGQFSGLASMAGIDLGGEGNEISKFDAFQYLLRAPVVAQQVSLTPVIMQGVFKNQWDHDNKVWKKSDGGAIVEGLKSIIGLDKRKPPNYMDLNTYIKKKLEISQVGDTSLIRISLTHADPKFAIFFIEKLRLEADNFLREISFKRASQELDYIEKRLNGNKSAEQLKALVSIYQMKEYEMMMLKTTLPIASKVLQGEVSSVRPVSPQPVFNLMLAFFLGVICSGFFIFIKSE